MGKNVKIGQATELITDNNSIIAIEDGVDIGSGCKIFARNGTKVILRKKSKIYSGTEIYAREWDINKGGNIEIGEYALIHEKNRIDITGNVYIAEHVRTGEGCFIHTHNHIYNKPGLIWTQGVEIVGVKIEKGCWIGTNVQIMPGTTIGEGTIIAAGAIVTKDIRSYVVAGGVPAKEIKERFKTKRTQQ